MKNKKYTFVLIISTLIINFNSFSQYKYEYTVPNVKLVIQPKAKVCWAAALTMMYNWKDGKNYTIENLLKSIPDNIFSSLYKQNVPLAQYEQELLIKLTGLQFDYPQSYTTEKWFEMLQTYGPLMVFWDDSGNGGIVMHAVVVYSIKSDDTNGYFLIMDPGRNASPWRVPYQEFIDKLESEAKYNPNYQNRIQVMYWPKKEEVNQSTEESYE
jgi:ABC-type bacteriocin/lantibiotic exporter with double-glycine peptidase domain